jgi:hypothetical protein
VIFGREADPDSEQIDHLFAAVFRVPDEPLSDGIDDEIQQFQRDPADQDGAVIGLFDDIACAVTVLNRQPDGTGSVQRSRAGAGPPLADTERLQAELGDKSPGQR